ncbi:MAG: hypothetical protein ACE5HE_11665, partial [Phycisphaerae bacterium]
SDAGARGDAGAFRQFRDRLDKLYRDPANTQAFDSELARQVSRRAAEAFADADLNAVVARALARVLADMSVPETFDALLAGLRTTDAGARFLCAKGLRKLQPSIAQDRAKLERTVEALKAAGLVETDAVVLAWIYLALSYPGQAEAVLDALLAIFDKRLEYRRGPAVFVDRAEVDAFDYLRQPGVLTAISVEQKAALAARLAVFLRLDAERYADADVGSDTRAQERTDLERRLDGLETCLEAIVGSSEGDIRGELRVGGHDRREAVLQQAYRWIGHPTTHKPGALNQPPWNVPIGAP